MTSEPSALKESKCVQGCRKWSRSWRQTCSVLKLLGVELAGIAMAWNCARTGRRALLLRVLDEIGCDIGGLHLVDLFLVAGKRPLDQKMVGHVADLHLENADRIANLRIVGGIDHLLLLGQSVYGRSLLQAVHLLLLQETPIALARE